MNTNTDALHELAGTVIFKSGNYAEINGPGFNLGVFGSAVLEHLTAGDTVSLSVFVSKADA